MCLGVARASCLPVRASRLNHRTHDWRTSREFHPCRRSRLPGGTPGKAGRMPALPEACRCRRDHREGRAGLRLRPTLPPDATDEVSLRRSRWARRRDSRGGLHAPGTCRKRKPAPLGQGDIPPKSDDPALPSGRSTFSTAWLSLIDREVWDELNSEPAHDADRSILERVGAAGGDCRLLALGRPRRARLRQLESVCPIPS